MTHAYKTFLPLLLPLAVGVGPASVVLGNLVAGKRIAQATGRDLGMIEDQDLVRKVDTPRSTLYSLLFKNLSLCMACMCLCYKSLIANY